MGFLLHFQGHKNVASPMFRPHVLKKKPNKRLYEYLREIEQWVIYCIFETIKKWLSQCFSFMSQQNCLIKESTLNYQNGSGIAQETFREIFKAHRP